MSRKGLTLPDVLVALVLAGIVGGIVVRVLLLAERHAARMALAGRARQTAVQASTWVAAELAEAGAPGGTADLLAAAADSLVYRSWRAGGLACLVTPTEVRLRLDLLSAWRTPQPGRDSLALLLALDSAAPARWLRLPIRSTAASSCGGHPALRVNTLLPDSLPSSLPPLLPARLFEIMTLRLYRSQGEWWLGGRSVSGGEGLQPVTGPFQPGGVEIRFAGPHGEPPLTPDSIRQVEVRLLPAGGDEVRQRLQLRNVP